MISVTACTSLRPAAINRIFCQACLTFSLSPIWLAVRRAPALSPANACLIACSFNCSPVSNSADMIAGLPTVTEVLSVLDKIVMMNTFLSTFYAKSTVSS